MIRGDTLAVALKLCDRIANTRASAGPPFDSKMKMYVNEYDGFRKALHEPGEWDGLWAELEFVTFPCMYHLGVHCGCTRCAHCGRKGCSLMEHKGWNPDEDRR